MTLKNKLLGCLLITGLLASGCTEDREQKEVLKYEVYSSDTVDPKKEFIYVPMTLSTSRHTTLGRAYTLGEERIVTMELGEFALNVYSIDKEKKFADNPSNKRLVMSIPVSHVDYRCADDAFGECTSEEVENNRIPWNQKKFFIPKFEETTFADANVLPSDLPDQCFETKKKKLLARKMDKTSINFTIERDYQNQLFFFCNRGLEDIADLNWSDVTAYSLVELNKVITPNYEKLVYNESWTGKFGFFEQEDFVLDIDGNKTQAGQVKYITRWDPKRTELKYYLNEAFDKPENAVIKSATYESVRRINQGLELANVNFRIKLMDYSPEINVGDLRNSMIILAEDPFEFSVIGYGPAVANPNSGEIISARTMMYSGSLKKFIKVEYDRIIQKQREIAAAANKIAPANRAAASGASGGATAQINSLSLLEKTALPLGLVRPELVKFEDPGVLIDVPVGEIDNNPNLTEADLDKATSIAQKRDQIDLLSKNNMYPAELIAFGDVNQEVIENLVRNIGSLEPWETLTDAQKQAVLDTMVPYVWIPTLVHELGHNLGLRHNFSGSIDKANFYSAKELGDLGVPVSEAEVPYSSIMDYPKSEINALRNFGKYDIAALKFGYRQEVEMANGQVVKVDPSSNLDNSNLALKPYEFCTDEFVALNANCNRFDEGTDYVTIAEALVDTMKNNFIRSNFRRGRANYSAFDDDLYMSSMNNAFGKMRLFYELYERITVDFGFTQEELEKVPWMAEVDKATEIIGDFLIDVVNQPDMNCVLQNVQTGSLTIYPKEDISKSSKGDCFDIALNDNFKMVAQTGKLNNSYKLPSNPNHYMDQIDYRGVWIDKAVAMKTLFRRKLNTPSNDNTLGNFMDHPKVAAKLRPLLVNILNDTNEKEVEFKDANGITVAPFTLHYSTSTDAYNVRAPYLSIVSRFLGIRYDNLYLAEILGKIAVNGTWEGHPNSNAAKLRRDLFVDTLPSNADVSCDLMSAKCSAWVNGSRLLAERENTVSFPLMQKLVKARIYEAVIDTTKIAGLTKVQNQLKAGSPPTGLTPEELAAYNTGLANVNEYMESSGTSSQFYETILLSLAM